MISLDVFSDPICPWCLIGKARLDRALADRPGHPFVVRWRPFMLNPDMPAGGMDRLEYLEAKFGGAEAAEQVYGAIRRTAEADGLDIDLGRISRTPSTLDAHRVTGWARESGRDHAFAQSLFDAYFSNGRDIGDRDVLAGLAGKSGMNADEVRRRLDTDEDVATIRGAAEAAAQAGVTGVPAFLIGGSRWVSGAQPTQFWIAAADALMRAAVLRRA